MPHLIGNNHSDLPDTGSAVMRSFVERQDVVTLRDPFSLMQAVPEKEYGDKLNDVVAVGFGPASLAIAVAIYDAIEERDTRTCAKGWMPRLKYLERQSSFGWHVGMLLPGTKMQISFIKDLATMRNPRSRFTFMNYLKEQNRLIQFSNLNTFLPLRIEFEDYLKWSAKHFDNIVEYSQNVTRVQPLKTGHSEKFNSLEVCAENTGNGVFSVHRCRKLVISVGGQPFIPPVFAHCQERIIHSSQYNSRVSDLLPNKEKAYTIVVVGAGQSAAETFINLQHRYSKSNVYLLIRDSALRPSDDSPFVNEVFNPEAVDTFFTSTQNMKNEHLFRNKTTNYSVVRLDLLEEIYAKMYQQRISEPDPTRWQHQILQCREITEVVNVPQCKRLNLTVKNLAGAKGRTREVLNVDAVVLATGYVRDAHNDLLKDCQVINGSSDNIWTVNRDYQVKLNRDFVTEDVQIYLQGCNEETHGLSDSLLSNLATRGGEIVNSIFGNDLMEAI